MRHKFSILLFMVLAATGLYAQQPAERSIRIVDTLSAQEKTNRNPVILKSEFDSLVNQYYLSKPPVIIKEVPGKDDNSIYMFIGLGVIVILSGFILYVFYANQKKLTKTLAGIKLRTQYSASIFNPDVSKVKANDKTGNGKTKLSSHALESKINELNAEMIKLTKENESLGRVVKEYNGIQHEFDSLKHGLWKAYKIKNYPGYDKSKTDISALQSVIDTENAVAGYAYEKFLKPILEITDDNKNNPAKINDEDKEKLLELLVSLSLLYIEYLYLRVNELSIGGKMVERIESLSNGNRPDTALLKKLNTEHGSRALVLRMILDKAKLHHLSYPVFDETDLNNQ